MPKPQGTISILLHVCFSLTLRSLSLVLLLLLCACNVYRPFKRARVTDDFLEEAERCLQAQDFACAIRYYEQLPEGSLKYEKLCVSYINQTGLSVKELSRLVSEPTQYFLGDLANVLLPWKQSQETGANGAVTFCEKYWQQDTASRRHLILRTLSLLLHCTVLVAKTDFRLAFDNQDAACTKPGNQDLVLTKEDISADNTGSLVAGGMCDTDVIACVTDITRIPIPFLIQAGLSKFVEVFERLPAALKEASTGTDAARAALRAGIR